MKPVLFESEYPEAAAFLAMIYAEPPRYHRNGAMHYFTKWWHFRANGECLELNHVKQS